MAGVQGGWWQTGLADGMTEQTGRSVMAVVTQARRAAVVLAMPSERIVAASQAAAQLLDAKPDDLLGRRLTEFTVPESTDAPALLMDGFLNGYQIRRTRVGHEPELSLDIWLRVITTSGRAAVAVAILSEVSAHEWEPVAELPNLDSVIGVMDQQLILDRVSNEIEDVLGYQPGDVLGQSLTQLLHPPDLTNLLFALGQTTNSQLGVSLNVRIRRAEGGTLGCDLVLLPLPPRPSCAFALQRTENPPDQLTVADVRLVLWRLGQCVAAARTARNLAEPARIRHPMLRELTARELQIVRRLIAGDRVPAIAAHLFIAQSTVRNHLSAVFAKMGVSSQQELIVLLRQSHVLGVDG